MKNLNEYPTPITDKNTVWAMDICGSNEVVDHETSRDLERKLAACRDAIEWLLADGTPSHKCGGHGGSSCCCTCARDLAVETLAATAP